MYEKNTDNNDLTNISQTFKYFTLGNLGQMNLNCGWSDFKAKFNATAEKAGPIKVDCGEGHIGMLEEFGFLYKKDKSYGAESDGEARC